MVRKVDCFLSEFWSNIQHIRYHWKAYLSFITDRQTFHRTIWNVLIYGQFGSRTFLRKLQTYGYLKSNQKVCLPVCFISSMVTYSLYSMDIVRKVLFSFMFIFVFTYNLPFRYTSVVIPLGISYYWSLINYTLIKLYWQKN